MENRLDLNLSIDDYHNGEGISASKLKLANKSTAHFFYKYDDEQDNEKTHFNVGHAFEDMFVEGGIVDDKYWVFNDSLRPFPDNNMNKAENKKWKEDLFSKNQSKKLLTALDWKNLQGMINSSNKPHIKSVLSGEIITQASGFWTDEETGLLCKTRPDIITKRKGGGLIITDIKTSVDSSPKGFSKQWSNLDYGLQCAMQVDGIQKIMNEEVLYYLYLVVEKTAPYNCSLYSVDFKDIDAHISTYKHLLRKVKRGMDEPKYINLGYAEDCGNNSGIIELEVPSWHYNK